MSSIFSHISARKPGSNIFNLSHDRKMSLNFGYITPILALDTVPGDRISMSTSQLLRMAPMIAPVMHQVSVYTHFFFVPNRILWPNWEDFITGGEDGTAAPVFPYMDIVWGESSLGDYMGVPPTDALPGPPTVRTSAMPFGAYQMIYNEYYRDQNISAPSNFELIDGDNSANAFLPVLRRRSWQHDYFTSVLPWTQKGPEATIPLGTTAPINFDETAGQQFATVWNTVANNPAGNLDLEISAVAGQRDGDMSIDIGGGTRQAATIDNSDNLSVDLSAATAATINDLRQAFRLQEWLEKNARGGSRYIESIMSHFGVKSSDGRLNRPEFLGGGSTPITISEVLQTSSAATEPTPQGNMAGHGIAAGANNSFSYYCEEHGYIIGLMTVMPKSAYQQGVPKHFTKFDKFDYFWPSFAHLGEQPVLNSELYWDNADGLNDDTFGYTPRYAEYKYMNSSVHGEFRSTLDFWHLGRKFATRPVLNSGFIQMNNSEVDRAFAVTGPEDRLYAHVYHRIRAKRKMPYFGTPTL